MQNPIRLISIWAGATLLALCGAMFVFAPARADVAPPESPPGVIISPGAETTQVRMLSEVVTLTLLTGSDQAGKAATTADFIMHNLGTTDENMDVRFPLTYGEALFSPGVYPEIKDFKVQVGGVSIPTKRTTSVDANSGSTIPWASFPVKFPVGQDVKISVSYTAQGFGYDPLLSFRYILETGAGWKDTIGSGDIIVRLPYPASIQNILSESEDGFSKVAAGPVFSGNEAAWHFENLEPTSDDNFEVRMVSPAHWKKILNERDNTTKNPQDGEAWGRLGKAIKEAIRNPKGDLRADDGGNQLYLEGSQAYKKAVTLLPKDAQWHYGYADLLWSHYLFGVYYTGSRDYSEVTRLAVEVKTALQINPGYQEAKDLASWISGTLPWALSETGQGGYDYLVLTATPTYVPDTVTPATETNPVASETATLELPTIAVENDTATPLSPAATPTPPAATPMPKVPVANNPLCGSILVFPFLFGLLWFISKKR